MVMRWILYLKAPWKFLSNNGGELANKFAKEMNKMLGFKMATILLSNGIMGKYNTRLYKAMSKTLDDTRYGIRMDYKCKIKKDINQIDQFLFMT